MCREANVYEKAAPSPLTARKCHHCGDPYRPVNKEHIYCTPPCRLKAWVLKTAAEMAGQSALFAEPQQKTEALEIGLAARAQVSSRAGNSLDELVPLARELAAGAGEHGITISDVRLAAERRGISLPVNLSSLGGLLRKAELTKTGRMRPSPIKSTHGRPQVVWIE